MYRKVIKKLLDLTLALILIILLSPIMLIISVMIKLDSKGPVIFKQIRSGKNNKNFTLYKFRSMTCNNNLYDTSVEDQVTKIGRILRKTSLDELPQLFNILKGEMSFIGPRPWIVDYAKYFTKHQMRRLEVLPGITGLAQCSGRNNLGIIERIDIDVEYVENMSLFLDIYIVLKTIKSVLKKEGFSNSKLAIHEELNILKNQTKSPNKRKSKKNYDKINQKVQYIKNKNNDNIDDKVKSMESFKTDNRKLVRSEI